MTSHLFRPFKLREIEFRNRIFMSPMCQYSCVDGLASDWHLVHLGSRAVGGAGLVMVEATGVSPEGRITHGDMGLWNDDQTEALRPIAAFVAEQGAVPAIQLAHAGRKASCDLPWQGGKPIRPEAGGWRPLAPSAVAFNEASAVPHALTSQEMDEVVAQFRRAAELARRAGFRVAEVHMAHGYLLHEFLSPLSNFRKDEFGGPLEARMRFPLRVAREVREIWPKEWPVFVRISASDWIDGGWDLAQSVVLARALRDLGVDLIDCSSGGLLPHAKIPSVPGYQVPFAEEIRKEAGIPTGAVGLITEARQAEEIVASGKADAVLLGREFLRDPYWPHRAARELGADLAKPKQYGRA